MLCKTCRHCGLCEGDGSFAPSKSLIAENSLFFSRPVKPPLCSPNDIGIALDIGTTTIAAISVELSSLRICARAGDENRQRAFGTDVMARISHALSADGLEEERKTVCIQAASLIELVFKKTEMLFKDEGRGKSRPVKIVVTGNTAMLSILCGVSVKGLASFPFEVKEKFGFETEAKKILSDLPDFFYSVPLYIPPVISPFVGADTTCALLACSFLHSEDYMLLCDVGTNCELALFNPRTKKITCTSCASGPAFEAGGVALGMAAEEGAVAKVSYSPKDGFFCRVIGDIKPKGICGSGLLSAVSCLVQNGFLDSGGMLLDDKESLFIAPNIFLTQKDIRSFQLAKAACLSGMQLLLKKENLPPQKISSLFLAGGFGTKLNAHDASVCRMIPSECENAVVHAGNASLSGAVMLLLSDMYRDQCASICLHSQSLDLASLPEFNSMFMASVSF